MNFFLLASYLMSLVVDVALFKNFSYIKSRKKFQIKTYYESPTWSLKKKDKSSNG